MHIEETVIEILSLSHSERTHGANIGCSKVKYGDKWEGTCFTCQKYAQLWKDGLKESAKQLYPVERYFYNCLINGKKDVYPASRTLAEIIGHRRGKFKIVKQMIETIIDENETRSFACYKESHFISD